MKTILILSDRPSNLKGYAIGHYALHWRKSGYRIIQHVGLANIPVADIVIVHVDLTVVPRAYIDSIPGSPTIINGKILDISRRRFSQLLLSRTDHWSGPVIVKTNANYGGVPEHSSERAKFIKNATPTLRETKVLNPMKYPVFRDIRAVPPDVWENKNLIVERFVSSRHRDLYSVSYCCFFGDKEQAGRLHSRNPIVKFGNCISDEQILVPDEVRRWRSEFQIDFGRFDYTEMGGQRYLIDINKTEAAGNLDDFPDEVEFLASGLDYFLMEDAGIMIGPHKAKRQGCADDMVVMGEVKESPLPLEDTLRNGAGVKDAAVVGIKASDGGDLVCVALVLTDDADVEAIRAGIYKLWAVYRVRIIIAVVDDLARTENGKVSRAKVRDFFRDQLEAEVAAS